MLFDFLAVNDCLFNEQSISGSGVSSGDCFGCGLSGAISFY